MDGNCKADQMKMKRPDDDVPIIDGEGYFASLEEYSHHLLTSIYHKQVIYCYYCPGSQQCTDKIPRKIHPVSILKQPERGIGKEIALAKQGSLLVLVHIMDVSFPLVWWICWLEKGE